jgi:hypothetical protein
MFIVRIVWNKQRTSVCSNEIFLVLRKIMYRLSVHCKRFRLCGSLMSSSVLFKLIVLWPSQGSYSKKWIYSLSSLNDQSYAVCRIRTELSKILIWMSEFKVLSGALQYHLSFFCWKELLWKQFDNIKIKKK